MFAALDKQPAAAAMANERRAIVATAMRTTIAPAAGWTLIEDNFMSGAYEWLVGDVVLRLSKTNRESRLAAALQGVQVPLFESSAAPSAPRDEAMIRLMGSPINGASVDVVAIGMSGAVSTPLPLRAIAAMQTAKIPNTGAPAAPRVTLPRTRRSAESG